MQVMVFMETGLDNDQQFGSTVPLHGEMAVLSRWPGGISVNAPPGGSSQFLRHFHLLGTNIRRVEEAWPSIKSALISPQPVCLASGIASWFVVISGPTVFAASRIA